MDAVIVTGAGGALGHARPDRSTASVQDACARIPVDCDAPVGLAGGSTPGALVDVDEETLESLWRSNFGSALWTAQAADAAPISGAAIPVYGDA